MSVIGLDMDGVLADFNSAYIDLMIEVSGRDLFPPRPFDIETWSYPEAFGYTDAEVKAAWRAISASPTFWFDLGHYPDTFVFLRTLFRRDPQDDIYFITSRPGSCAKFQTESWLQVNGWSLENVPTVLISDQKGECCHALKIDYYLDDKNENVVDVARKSPNTKVYMLARPWNQQQTVVNLNGFTFEVDREVVIPRIPTLSTFLEAISHGH